MLQSDPAGGAIPSDSLRAHIEAPLLSRDGIALGFLWAAADPSRRWTTADQSLLEDLAGSAVTELELFAAQEEIAARIRSAADDREAAETKYLSLYTSGFTNSAVADRGVAVEDPVFLAKPFSAAALTAKVLEVLEPA